MIKVVLCRNNYYLFDGFNFYGSFHSCAEAEFRAPEKEKYKIDTQKSHNMFTTNTTGKLIMNAINETKIPEIP